MGKFKNNAPALKCRRTNGKIALLLLISLFSIEYSFSQNVITNPNGDKIILNTDGTWSVEKKLPTVIPSDKSSPKVISCEQQTGISNNKTSNNGPTNQTGGVCLPQNNSFYYNSSNNQNKYVVKLITLNNQNSNKTNDIYYVWSDNTITSLSNNKCSNLYPSNYMQYIWYFDIDYGDDIQRYFIDNQNVISHIPNYNHHIGKVGTLTEPVGVIKNF